MTKNFIATIFALILLTGLGFVVFSPSHLQLGIGLILTGGIGVAALSQGEEYD